MIRVVGMDGHLGDHLRLALPLLAGVLMGGVLGWEREARRKVAGLRTHILVALSEDALAWAARGAPPSR